MADDGSLQEDRFVHPRFKMPYVAISLAAGLNVFVMVRTLSSWLTLCVGDLAFMRAARRPFTRFDESVRISRERIEPGVIRSRRFSLFSR
jgi:hypothetical protein